MPRCAARASFSAARKRFWKSDRKWNLVSARLKPWRTISSLSSRSPRYDVGERAAELVFAVAVELEPDVAAFGRAAS